LCPTQNLLRMWLSVSNTADPIIDCKPSKRQLRRTFVTISVQAANWLHYNDYTANVKQLIHTIACTQHSNRQLYPAAKQRYGRVGARACGAVPMFRQLRTVGDYAQRPLWASRQCHVSACSGETGQRGATSLNNRCSRYRDTGIGSNGNNVPYRQKETGHTFKFLCSFCVVCVCVSFVLL